MAGLKDVYAKNQIRTVPNNLQDKLKNTQPQAQKNVNELRNELKKKNDFNIKNIFSAICDNLKKLKLKIFKFFNNITSKINSKEKLETIDDINEPVFNKKEWSEKFIKYTPKIKKGIITLVIFYIIFLIYGVSVTKYAYNSEGYSVPVSMTVKQIKEEKEYEELLEYYITLKQIYIDVLDIDYELSQNTNDANIIATKYEGQLERIDKYLTKLKALNTKSDYALLQTMLNNWASNDIAIYLQNVAKALTTNDSELTQIAIQNREQCKVDFNTITDNFVNVGKTIRGVDVSDLENWSADNYYKKLMIGG